MLCNEIDDLTLVGPIGLRDPLHADVKDAVRVITGRSVGIKIFMITGDFMITAVGISKQVLISLSLFRSSWRAILTKLFSGRDHLTG
jgi:sodium/potassium-transporting ATPase subunit alpha